MQSHRLGRKNLPRSQNGQSEWISRPYVAVLMIFVQPISKLFGGQTSVLKMARLEWDSLKTKINTNKKQIKSTVSSKSIQFVRHFILFPNIL